MAQKRTNCNVKKVQTIGKVNELKNGGSGFEDDSLFMKAAQKFAHVLCISVARGCGGTSFLIPSRIVKHWFVLQA
jgi:hypothetical protein